MGVFSFFHKTSAFIWLCIFLNAPAFTFAAPEQNIEKGPSIENVPSTQLDVFFEQLRLLQQQKRNEPLRIMQLGDEHTASDDFVNRLREKFQNQFGNAGIGWIAPGKSPYQRSMQYTMTADRNWQLWHHLTRYDLSFGLGGMVGATTMPHTGLVFQPKKLPPATDQNPYFLDLFAISSARTGEIRVTLNDQISQRYTTRADHSTLNIQRLTLTETPKKIKIESMTNFPVYLTGMSLERAMPGVVVDNFGISRGQVGLIQGWSSALLEMTLKYRPPQLIMLQFGLTEASSPQFTAERYEHILRTVVRNLRQLAPNTALLLILPPDNAQRIGRCSENQRKFLCDGTVKKTCGWQVYPMLEKVREIQAKVAIQERIPFWNWAKTMGTDSCRLQKWVKKDPALVKKDYHLLTTLGYEYSADLFYEALMNQYYDYTLRVPTQMKRPKR